MFVDNSRESFVQPKLFRMDFSERLEIASSDEIYRSFINVINLLLVGYISFQSFKQKQLMASKNVCNNNLSIRAFSS